MIDPADVGVDASSIILTARSGRAALKHRFDCLGYATSSKADLDELYTKFLVMADSRKQIDDKDLKELFSAHRM